jgi:hypothetical protein
MFARIMPVDDLDRAFGADARMVRASRISRAIRAPRFRVTLQFGVFRI